MFVIDVIPFSKSAPAGTLSYRSRVELAPGTLVSVMLRRARITAMVVHCESALHLKSSLKRASFVLSKSEPVPEGALKPSVIAAARALSLSHAASLGSVLTALLGEYVRAELPLSGAFSNAVRKRDFSFHPLEAPIDARAEAYAKVLSAQDPNSCVHLIVPTIAEAYFWQDRFKENAPVVLTSALAPKARVAATEKAMTHVGLIISTPSYAWLPQANRSAYLVDRVSAGGYALPKRPYLDMRAAVRELARAEGIPVYFGDYPLPLEFRSDPAAPLAEATVPIRIFDARDKDTQEDKKPWKAIAEPLLEEISEELARGGRVALLAVRKGYAPTVVCRDCGQAATDERGAVLSFSQDKGERVLRSSDGATLKAAEVFCARCRSWNLYPLGVGVERVEEEARKAFPGVPIVVLEAEKLRTRAAARKALDGALVPGSIIVGTEGMLPWLLLARDIAPITLGVVASADSLLSLPFWRSRERFVRLVQLFASLSSRLIVSTRRPDDAALSPAGFFAEEMAMRVALGYPPAGTLIAVQLEGTKNFLDKESARVQDTLKGHEPIQLPDRPISPTTYRRSWVLKLPADTWPNAMLSGALSALGPSVRVLIDPESLW